MRSDELYILQEDFEKRASSLVHLLEKHRFKNLDLTVRGYKVTVQKK